MPKQPYRQKSLLFHAMVCHFLENEIGGGDMRKNDKNMTWGLGGYGLAILRVTYFLNDPLLRYAAFHQPNTLQ